MVSASWSSGQSGAFFGMALAGMATISAAAHPSEGWALHTYAFRFGDGTSTLISVVGGPPGVDPLAGLDGVRVPGATPGDDVIYAGPGSDTLEGGPGNDTLAGGAGPDLFIYRLGDGNDIITDFDPQQDRLVILGAASVNIVATAAGAVAHLPDGATIQILQTMDSAQSTHPNDFSFG